MTVYQKLEQMIDKYSVADVLIAIKDICDEKAEHIDMNWQDTQLANQWKKAAREIQKTVMRLPKVPGIK